MLFRRPPTNVPTISLYDAVSNPAGLFGNQFADESWMPWRVVLAALEGRPLDAQGVSICSDAAPGVSDRLRSP